LLIQGLITGIIVGFIISMPPLGPTYFAIIERALRKELANAVAIGAGAGFLDMVYVLVAFGGVSAIVSLLPYEVDGFFLKNENLIKTIFAVAGCLVVIAYGAKMLMTSRIKPQRVTNIAGESPEIAEKVEQMESKILSKEESLGKIFHIKQLKEAQQGVVGSFFLGVGFCLSSVTLPASWLAIVGYLKSYGVIDTSFSTGLMLSIGVFIGTVLFFYLMSRLLSKHTDKIKPNLVSKLNFSTGLFLIVLGASVLVKISTILFE
jgi:threonine/homoserine/homoserine lactone efflux protein